jgi:Druantia protein DruA
MSRIYCGRTFDIAQIDLIRTLIAEHPHFNRAQLSRLVCEALQWQGADGRSKQMSCRVALLRMHDDGLIELPLPRNGNGNARPYARRTPGAEPELFGVEVSVETLVDLRIEPVSSRRQSHLWNEYVDRYHYLRYQPLGGAQLRYFACSANRPLALLGFAAAAWKVHARDRFIGWTAQQRQARLHLIVNNSRFLILPWVRCDNLASRVLALSTRRLAGDWQLRYGYRPVLLETFVESPRFKGTCYRAANWICLGETQGRGKRDVHHQGALPRKSLWVYPLVAAPRNILCAPE